MNLPAWITRVCYKVAGSYGYRGDLVIAKGAICYFPHTDLRKKWEQQPEIGGTLKSLSPAFGPLVSDMSSELEGETISLFDQPSPTIDLKKIWSENRSAEELQFALDAYFVELKQHGSTGKSSSDLPSPRRYGRYEIKNLTLTSFGVLKFDAQFDDHIFKVGIINKGKTQKALQEGGYFS